MSLPDEILAESPVLFHDMRAKDIDPEMLRRSLSRRVLDRGTMRSVRALLHHYGRDRVRVRRFFIEGGVDRVSRRTIPLWAAFLQFAPDECTPRS